MNEHMASSKIAEALLLRPEGATMDDIIAATGGPQYNLLRRLKARGFAVRSEKEGRRTRYFLAAPPKPYYDANLSKRGQVTIPAEIRRALHLQRFQKVRFTLAENGTVIVAPVRKPLSDLFGMLGKPPKSLTIEEMDEAIGQAVVERFRRAVGGKSG